MKKILYFLKTFFLAEFYCPINMIFSNRKTKKEYQVIAAKPFINHFKCNLFRVSKNTINHSNNIIYFSNHRSWADFFIDQINTEYSCKYLSRWIVAFWLPLWTYICGYLINDMVIFFKRNAKNIDYLEKLIKYNQIHNSGNNILVYPEGTRRAEQNYACDLKKGLIYYSYKENCPIQFIISKNKEKVLNEKKYISEKNINIFVHYSDVYYPDTQKYKSIEEYYNFINSEWKTIFNSVYNTDYEKNIKEYPEIDKFKIYDNNYNVDYKKIYFFRFCLISTAGLIPAFFLKYFKII